MSRRASPCQHKVLGVRKRHAPRTGTTSTNKHETVATTIEDEAQGAATTACASLGRSPRHPPPLRPLPGITRRPRCTCLRRTPAMHPVRIARAASHRCADALWCAAASAGRSLCRRRHGRGKLPAERARHASSMASTSLQRTGLSREIFWNDGENSRKEEIRLRSLLRGPRYDVKNRIDLFLTF